MFTDWEKAKNEHRRSIASPHPSTVVSEKKTLIDLDGQILHLIRTHDGTHMNFRPTGSYTITVTITLSLTLILTLTLNLTLIQP